MGAPMLIGRRNGAAQEGFSYLVLLLWVAITSAGLAALGPLWSMEGRREREQEFVFRAEQYRQAIASYVVAINVNGCGNLSELPERLEELLEDRRCGLVRHHLRRLYGDPITKSNDWGLVMESGRIRGVYSRSELRPVRRIEGVERYRDWVFVGIGPVSAAAQASSSSVGPDDTGNSHALPSRGKCQFSFSPKS